MRWGRSTVGLVALSAALVVAATFGVVGVLVLVVDGGGGTAATAATAASAASAASAAGGCTASTPRLTVQGTGQASGTPDVLTAVFTFSTTAGTSADALTQNSAKVARALAALAGNGVAGRDVQTTALSLAPQYAYPHGVATLTGYQATETVSAALRHRARAGTAIDAVVGAAGDAAQITSLTFSFGDPAHVQDQARTSAVHLAVTHAQAMAAAAGRRLGAVCSLTDNTQQVSPLLNQDFAEALPASGQASVPLEAGTQVETDQVTLVYALAPR
jgi:uncharacterized protein YggE